VSEWALVPKGAQLKVGEMTPLSTAGQHIIVYRTADGFYASERRCTHQGADLMRGYFDQHVIECPVHQGRFNVCTGAALSAPASQPLKTYAVQLVDGQVYVDVQPGPRRD
jgi:nitrite reductase/ring-hydroxylating ferredoxin subunit